MIRAGWPQFDGDFKRTLNRLKDLSQLVDREAEAARLKIDHKRNAELEEALQALQVSSAGQVALPCHYLPSLPTRSFFGRQDVLASIENSLKSDCRCVLLHGLGGVGKSRTALEYANTRRSRYDVIIWIPADSKLKVQHAVYEFAKSLGLVQDTDDVSESSLALMKVKSWLSSTGTRIC